MSFSFRSISTWRSWVIHFWPGHPRLPSWSGHLRHLWVKSLILLMPNGPFPCKPCTFSKRVPPARRRSDSGRSRAWRKLSRFWMTSTKLWRAWRLKWNPCETWRTKRKIYPLTSKSLALSWESNIFDLHIEVLYPAMVAPSMMTKVDNQIKATTKACLASNLKSICLLSWTVMGLWVFEVQQGDHCGDNWKESWFKNNTIW